MNKHIEDGYMVFMGDIGRGYFKFYWIDNLEDEIIRKHTDYESYDEWVEISEWQEQ